jgi:hypothetical protein
VTEFVVEQALAELATFKPCYMTRVTRLPPPAWHEQPSHSDSIFTFILNKNPVQKQKKGEYLPQRSSAETTQLKLNRVYPVLNNIEPSIYIALKSFSRWHIHLLRSHLPDAVMQWLSCLYRVTAKKVKTIQRWLCLYIRKIVTAGYQIYLSRT